MRARFAVAGVLATTVLFLSPIFYPADRIPESFRPFYDLNPLVPMIEAFRAALFEGQLPDPRTLLVLTALCWGVAWLGYAGFMRTRKGFADVL
jgi:lipopolysaccharide transport system permease protein